MNSKKLFLCAGMQSGGTTLVSWCFLQRHDMDGIFDMDNPTIEFDLSKIITPFAWVKMTIGSFRWQDVASSYEDAGWEVVPLLVVRDVRAIYASLSKKWYGHNGNIAEDPPLRMRFRRFLEDWNLFIKKKWPILNYENLVESPVEELKKTVEMMNLQWDSSMIDWLKKEADISYMGLGNETFRKTALNYKTNLIKAIEKDKLEYNIYDIPLSDLYWLENEFSYYNEINNYPKKIAISKEDIIGLQGPKPIFEGSRRYRLQQETERLQQETERLQQETERLQQETERLQQEVKKLNYKIDKLYNHIVIGIFIKFWKKFINQDIV